jgi:hypothetical protein
VLTNVRNIGWRDQVYEHCKMRDFQLGEKIKRNIDFKNCIYAEVCIFPSILILCITKSPPSQHINSCSSLHRRNGARNLGGNPSLIWEMVGGKERAYLFIAQTGRYIVYRLGTSDVPSLHASTGRSPENPFYRDRWFFPYIDIVITTYAKLFEFVITCNYA